MEYTELKGGFIIVTNTLCQGDIPGCWEDDQKPVVFETAVEAWKEIADSMVEKLQQFIDGERELEDTPFETDEWVEEVSITEKGVMFNQAGKCYYNPITNLQED